MIKKTAKVGDFEIEVSDKHIYLAQGLAATYDYGPWNLIREIIASAKLKNIHLIDIGANVGDSLAHFRRFSDAPATCIEPSSVFFSILKRNAEKFGNVSLENKLLVPADKVGKVVFSSNEQTGSTRSASEASGELLWQGQNITFEQLFKSKNTSYIVKSDTDGFDVEIIGALADMMSRSSTRIPIIFFEGPSAVEFRKRDFAAWMTVFMQLQYLGYELLFLTNHGLPYAFAGNSIDAVAGVLNSLSSGYESGYALCHYFDIVAVHRSLNSKHVRLEQSWRLTK